MVEVYETLPIVPLRDVVVFPHMMMPFVIGRPSSIRALEHALAKDKRIFLAAQHDAAVDDPGAEDVFGPRIVDRGIVLRREEDALVLEQRVFERPRRRRPPDDERHHHVRKDDDVAQRNDGKGLVNFQRG